MKMKILIALIVLAALLAGFFIGRHQATQIYQQKALSLIQDTVHRCAWQEGSCDLIVLKYFREGHQTEGLDALEKCLDGSLIAAYSTEQTKKGFVPTLVQDAHDYRAKQPWTNSAPEIDAKIKNILSRANSK
jgi:hypothetical protein